MPLYVYKCPQGHDFEELQKVADRDSCKCPECGTPSKRQVTAARLDYYNMGVSDSFPTALQKWEKMHRHERRREYD